ncbi:MAG: hypothetical protein V4850_36990 [Myxococcota bacterium]
MRFPTLILLALAGCTGGKPDDTSVGDTETADTHTDTATAPLDPATVPLNGACALADDHGGFNVTVLEDATTVAGTVADGVVPATVLEELVREGDCAVLRRNNPYCEPTCPPGETCAFDGTCVPYPANQGLGTVTLDGLVVPVVMEPVFPGNTYYDTSLPHPAYTPGELLTLSMPGGVYGPLELYGVGVEPLDLPDVVWVIEGGVDYVLDWPAPAGAVVRSEIAIQISIDQHGVSPSVLRCVFADDGQATIPGAVLSALVDVGVTGFPAASIERRTVDQGAAGAGCLDFVVTSPHVPTVDVVGSTPCVSDNECPDDQTCNVELQICE